LQLIHAGCLKRLSLAILTLPTCTNLSLGSMKLFDQAVIDFGFAAHK